MTDRRPNPSETTVGVVGVGYVGLTLATAFADAGFEVVGVDIDPEKVDCIRRGESYIDDINDPELRSVSDTLTATTDVAALSGCNVIVFAVQTGETGGDAFVDLADAVEAAARQRPSRQTLYVIASTVAPNTVASTVRPALRRAGAADTAEVAVVPERINPAGTHDLSDIPVVVGAETDEGSRYVSALFDYIANWTVATTSPREAALSKLIENTYRLVNISLVNDIARYATELDVDIWNAIEAASSKPFGFKPFYPGVGAGGHCVPVDPQFLTRQDIGADVPLPTVEASLRVNDCMPGFVAERALEALWNSGVDPVDERVVVLGISYKPNVSDTRESPSIEVCRELQRRGVSVVIVDPHADEAAVPDGTEFVRSATEVNFDDTVGTVALVNHDKFDLDAISDRSEFVFNATTKAIDRENVERFGVPNLSDSEAEEALRPLARATGVENGE